MHACMHVHVHVEESRVEERRGEGRRGEERRGEERSGEESIVYWYIMRQGGKVVTLAEPFPLTQFTHRHPH